MYYVVKYTGQFGFIKPYSSVRDGITQSLQFLTQSTIAGIERKLFPELLKLDYSIYKIKRYRLNYSNINWQQEVVQARGWNKNKNSYERQTSIINRGILVNPILYLSFDNINDAEIANTQHICLCRNEDLLLPSGEILEIEETEFDNKNTKILNGFELIFKDSELSFNVGLNRFNNNKMERGYISEFGKPFNISKE